MAYIVLAAGAVMALLGALAIITGYPIIQIERGWATVIAGSTLLAGGVVTMAVGLMVRGIIDVRAALADASIGLPHPADPAMQTLPHTEPALHVEPDHPPADHAPAYASAALVATAVAVPVLATAVRHEPETDPRTDEVEPAHPVALHERVEADHHAEPLPQEPVDSPPMDDWLDKAFATLALDTPSPVKEADHGPSTQVAPEPLHADHVAAQHDGEILYAGEHDRSAHPHETHADEPAHDLAHHETEHEVPVGYEEPAHPVPHAEPVEPIAEPTPAAANEPAVIGRYEADGTAYTMFADGSIEAQSDAGIYRFASMADLKAFIEG